MTEPISYADLNEIRKCGCDDGNEKCPELIARIDVLTVERDELMRAMKHIGGSWSHTEAINLALTALKRPGDD